MARLIRFSCVAVSLFYSLLAFAQSPQPQTYGTQDEIALVLQSSAFTPMNSTITYGGDIVRFVTNNNGCCLVAPVSLPSGASVIGIEVQGCDNSATAGITSVFTACDLTNCTGLSQYVSTPANSGCGRFRANFASPITVHGATDSFTVSFYHTGDVSGSVSLEALRVFYKLQVSPAPLTARYTDVPTTHPFFQYIEALASAGITAGCSASPPQYCPDSPVTRGQMAVFLARALGLHWVP